MTTEENINNIIAGAKSAIASRAEAMRLIYQAHDYVYEFTEAKIKELDQRTTTIRDHTSSYVDKYLASKDKSLKPHYDRAETAMLQVSKIEEEVKNLQAAFDSTKDINRKRRLNKMIELKMWEFEHIEKLGL